MKPPHRFIGKTRGMLDGKHWAAMGKAQGLFDFLIDNQTDPHGSVYYSREIGYDWIRYRLPNAPALRTLERWMCKLKAAGYIRVSRVPYGGFKIRILKPKKWARQGKLFGSGKPVEKPVENLLKPAIHLPPQVAVSLPPQVAVERSIRKDFEQTYTERQPQEQVKGCGKLQVNDENLQLGQIENPVQFLALLKSQIQEIAKAKSL